MMTVRRRAIFEARRRVAFDAALRLKHEVRADYLRSAPSLHEEFPLT